jgi:hypothetical protein
MKTDKEKLQTICEKWGTEELLMAVTVNKDDYDPVALDIINRELEKRNIENRSKEEFQTAYLKKKRAVMNSGEFYCPKCYLPSVTTSLTRLCHDIVYL